MPEYEIQLNLLARTEEEIAAAKGLIENDKPIWEMEVNANTSYAAAHG